MAVPLLNNFEGGSDGTTITTGNSGGASGNAFTSVFVPATHTVVFKNSPVLTGNLCGLMTPGGTNGFPQFEWDAAAVGTIGPVVYTRHYFRVVGSFLTQNQRSLFLNSGASLACGMGYIAATAKFTWIDSGNSLGTSSTNALSVDTTYRFECQWTLSATVGQAVINLYAGNSTSVIETLTSPASQNFLGTTMDRVDWGLNSGGTNANTPPTAFDSLAIGTTGYFGPAAAPQPSDDPPIGYLGRGAGW